VGTPAFNQPVLSRFYRSLKVRSLGDRVEIPRVITQIALLSLSKTVYVSLEVTQELGQLLGYGWWTAWLVGHRLNPIHYSRGVKV
jgi:hypothetical protein